MKNFKTVDFPLFELITERREIATLYFLVNKFDRVVSGSIWNGETEREITGPELKCWISAVGEDRILEKSGFKFTIIDDMAFAKKQKEYAMDDDSGDAA